MSQENPQQRVPSLKIKVFLNNKNTFGKGVSFHQDEHGEDVNVGNVRLGSFNF
jgi:hypothetical protein